MADQFCTDASYAEVAAKTAAAGVGDTIYVPGGISGTWTGQISTTQKYLVGGYGGGGRTQITISNVDSCIPHPQGVRGFDFELTGSSVDAVNTTIDTGWRITDCSFTNTADTNQMIHCIHNGAQWGHPYGLIDHCEFFGGRILVIGDSQTVGHLRWKENSTIGTGTNAVFVENCEFTMGRLNCIDANQGGRYVFRYNTVLSGDPAGCEAHSIQGNHRGTRSWEIYNNTFEQPGAATLSAINLRGGTGVVFNNTMVNYNAGIVIDNYRSFTSFGFPPGDADGSSPWDGPGGYPCRDQIGTGKDDAGDFPTLITDPYLPQASEPAYFWNNTLDASPVNPEVVNCASTIKPNGSCSDIQVNRDYYNSARPGYTPFTYPHPLQGSRKTKRARAGRGRH